MLSYEFLDRVADSHNPILGATWLVLSVLPAFSHQWRAVLVRFFLGISYLLVAYGFMWLDSATGIWGKFNLDYSTHTAVAFAMAAAVATISRKLGISAAVLVSIYIPLMIYQGYHTLGDIFSTAAVASPPVLLMAHTIRKRRWAAANNSFKPTSHRGGLTQALAVKCESAVTEKKAVWIPTWLGLVIMVAILLTCICFL